MVAGVRGRNEMAERLFGPIAETYDRYARILSLGCDPRWRSFLVSRLELRPEDVVLDVACGTAAVAIAVAQRHGCSVVGVDVSEPMLAKGRLRVARLGLDRRIRLEQAHADQLPFEAASFDALTFTYLLRYVDDPGTTLRELARVVRPGGTIASLEFGLPQGALARALWNAYVGVGLPAAGRLISPGWSEVGRFLGTSIRSFYERYPLERQRADWRTAGVEDVRVRKLTLGGAVVVWGKKTSRPPPDRLDSRD